MATLFHYIDQVKEIELTPNNLNEVDILIINELTYLPFDLYLSPKNNYQNPKMLYDLFKEYQLNSKLHHIENAILATEKRYKLFEKVAEAPRYRDISAFNFVNHFSEKNNKQFCALTYRLPGNQLLVSYRGTDDTLVGWKEDFKLAYEEDIPSQLEAKKYISSIIKEVAEDAFMISGHSKGGNLALIAGLSLPTDVIETRLLHLYLFDSPGLTATQIHLPEYQALKPYIYRYIPEDSVVGKMMFHDIKPIIVKSNHISVFQHDIMHWRIQDTQIERTTQTTDASNIIDRTLKQWCDQYSATELATFFDFGFQLLELAGAKTLNDISKDLLDFIKKVNLVKADIDNEKKEQFMTIGNQLLVIWKENYHQHQKEKIHSIRTDVSDFFENLSDKTRDTFNLDQISEKLPQSLKLTNLEQLTDKLPSKLSLNPVDGISHRISSKLNIDVFADWLENFNQNKN